MNFNLALEARPQEDIIRSAKLLQYFIVSSVVIFIVWGISLWIWLARTISRPLNELEIAASEIGKGKLDTRVAISSDNEIGVLGKTINRMAKDLGEITVSRNQYRDAENKLKEIQAQLILEP